MLRAINTISNSECKQIMIYVKTTLDRINNV